LLFKCFFISCCNCFLFFSGMERNGNTFGWLRGLLGRWCWNTEHGFNSDAVVVLRFRLVFASSKKSRLEFWKLCAKCSCNKVGQEICSWEHFIVHVFVFGTAVLPYFIYTLLFCFCVVVIVLSFVSTPEMLQFRVGPLRKCLAATPRAQKIESRYGYTFTVLNLYLLCKN